MGTIRDFQLAMAMESENLRLDPEVCLRGVSRVFAEPALGEYWIMEIPGPDGRPRIVGCTLIQTEWSDWRARKVLWIHSLYVLPEFRGQGLTREIYETFRSRVKSDANLAGLRLYVDQKNPNAIAVYEKMGMTREHYHLYEWMKS
ncbi:MAG: GNAT family N-acetyltransferase [Bdellovibrionales bacterium]|nr:GNAT family N-acetyltransferase [Bdellovibrionales bacterium]